jgi:hypothetical protein
MLAKSDVFDMKWKFFVRLPHAQQSTVKSNKGESIKMQMKGWKISFANSAHGASASDLLLNWKHPSTYRRYCEACSLSAVAAMRPAS